MQGIIGSARVGLRLGWMALDAAFTVSRLRWRARRGRTDPHAAARTGHAWSRRMLAALGVELEVRGRAPVGPVLLLANHRSYVDIPAILSQVPCAFLAKAEIGDWPLFGSAARLVNTVFVERECKASRRASRAAALERLRSGLPFAAFPEGTTSRAPGMLPFFPGLFELAAEHGVPVVPVAIEYADPDDAWVDDDSFVGHFLRCFRKRRVRVTLRFGPALFPGDVDDPKAYTEMWIRARIEAAAADPFEASETGFEIPAARAAA